jgi:hypothetical protein
MKKLTHIDLYEWRVTNKEYSVFLSPLEQDLQDCRIEGRAYDLYRFDYPHPFRIQGMIREAWAEKHKGETQYFVSTTDGLILKLCEPNADYARLMKITTKILIDCIQRKSN